MDNTLELLGIPKEYCKMRNSVKWIFIIWFLIIGMTWFIDSFWFIENYNDIRAMFIPIMKNYPLHINSFIDIMYMFVLRFVNFILSKLFDRFNKFIIEG